MDHNKLWKISEEMAVSDYLIYLLRNLYKSQEATELDLEQWTGSKLEKEYVKAVHCHPDFLTYRQSTATHSSILTWGIP